MCIVVREGTTDAYHYTYTDHLGSILTVTNSSGAIEAEQSFDAWGRNRNPDTWTYDMTNVAPNPAWLYRGFTGHEHLPEFKLINMNGRLYDPILGRMLSVDNYVQAPLSSQGYNRYSYVFNNPLKYIDPSGEMWGQHGYYKQDYIKRDPWGFYDYGGINRDLGGDGSWTNYSYNWETGTYTYRGQAVSFNEVMSVIENTYSSYALVADWEKATQILNSKGYNQSVHDFTSAYINAKGQVVLSYNKPTLCDLDFPNGFMLTGTQVTAFVLPFKEMESILENTSTSRGIATFSTQYITGGMESMMEPTNPFNKRIIAEGTKSFGKATFALKVVGGALGLVSAYDHFNKAKNAFKEGDRLNGWINIGKIVLDGVFIFGKASNPIILFGGMTYAILDMSGALELKR